MSHLPPSLPPSLPPFLLSLSSKAECQLNHTHTPFLPSILPSSLPPCPLPNLTNSDDSSDEDEDMGPRPLEDELDGGRDGGRSRNFGGALMPGEVSRKGGREGRRGGREGGQWKREPLVRLKTTASLLIPPSLSPSLSPSLLFARGEAIADNVKMDLRIPPTYP